MGWTFSTNAQISIIQTGMKYIHKIWERRSKSLLTIYLYCMIALVEPNMLLIRTQKSVGKKERVRVERLLVWSKIYVLCTIIVNMRSPRTLPYIFICANACSCRNYCRILIFWMFFQSKVYRSKCIEQPNMRLIAISWVKREIEQLFRLCTLPRFCKTANLYK